MRRPVVFSLFPQLVLCALLAPGRAPAQSRHVDDYVLLAQTSLRLRAVEVTAGDLGVNDGALLTRSYLRAPNSTLAASVVRLDAGAECGALVANLAATAPSQCAGPTPFASPIVGDLAAACGMPTPLPACDPTLPALRIARTATTVLPPGRYGDVVVEGPGAGTLVLDGDYAFCSLRASRAARILARGPSTIVVGGSLTVSNAAYVGPDPGVAAVVRPNDVRVFVAGTRVRFSRHAEARAILCAPEALLTVAGGSRLDGRFVAAAMRVTRASVGLVPGGAVTTTSTTTTSVPGGSSTTTVPPSCGNGRRDPGEECDGADLGGVTCSSPAGALLGCTPACTLDRGGCDTLCGDGVADGLEVCDGSDFRGATCPATGTPEGLVCTARCTLIDTGACPSPTTTTTLAPATTTTTLPAGLGEVCGNCVDDDGDGMTDLEDDECCAPGQTFRMGVRRGRMKPRGTRTRLRLRAALPSGGLRDIAPVSEDVIVQLRPTDGSDFLCARIPAERFRRKRRTYRFRDKAGRVASARGISRVKITVRKDGRIRARVSGRSVAFRTPSPGAVQATIGFFDPARPVSANRCAVAAVPFRATRRGALRLTP